MGLLRLGGTLFSCGRARFLDAPPTTPSTSARIYVQVAAEGIEESFLALLDTGADYSVLDPELAEQLGVPSLEEDRESQRMRLSHRGGTSEGRLIRLSLRLLADEGEDLSIESTVFVPDTPLPFGTRYFLGYTGFLERVRIAIDPGHNDLYFGDCA